MYTWHIPDAGVVLNFLILKFLFMASKIIVAYSYVYRLAYGSGKCGKSIYKCIYIYIYITYKNITHRKTDVQQHCIKNKKANKSVYKWRRETCEIQ